MYNQSMISTIGQVVVRVGGFSILGISFNRYSFQKGGFQAQQAML